MEDLDSAVGEVIFSLAVCTALDTALLISVGLEEEAVVDVVGVFLAEEVSLLVFIVEVELVVVELDIGETVALTVVLELLVVVVAVVGLYVGYTI